MSRERDPVVVAPPSGAVALPIRRCDIGCGNGWRNDGTCGMGLFTHVAPEGRVRARKRDPDIAAHIEQTLTRFRELYAEVVRRGQAAGHLDPAADPTHVGAVLMGLVHAFAIQRLLLPGTDRDQYVASVRVLLTQWSTGVT